MRTFNRESNQDWIDGAPEIAGAQFGVNITNIGGRAGISLYSEDDETFHETMNFSAFWLNDLIKVLQETKEKLEKEYEKDPEGWGYLYKE